MLGEMGRWGVLLVVGVVRGVECEGRVNRYRGRRGPLHGVEVDLVEGEAGVLGEGRWRVRISKGGERRGK